MHFFAVDTESFRSCTMKVYVFPPWCMSLYRDHWDRMHQRRDLNFYFINRMEKEGGILHACRDGGRSYLLYRIG